MAPDAPRAFAEQPIEASGQCGALLNERPFRKLIDHEQHDELRRTVDARWGRRGARRERDQRTTLHGGRPYRVFVAHVVTGAGNDAPSVSHAARDAILVAVDRCLDDNLLAAYWDGTLSSDELARFDSHLATCVACRGDLSALAVARSTGAVPEGDPTHELIDGATIGRYVVVRERGRGAMGVVAIALDPELGRQIALKLLRPEIAASAEAQAQLREEARAMARLDHPNVVGVHDVGEHDGRMFVAMDLVEGIHLRAWLLDHRTWRQIVRTCVRAGRGIAAAHRAGLVHRDIKPENVLVGPDDRVRVTDFGLARGEPEPGARATGIAGTPLYMAPEIWRREPATPRSDQWSFCVMLYEALFGAPPFRATSARELAAAIQRGAFEMPRGRVPARVTRALARGLQVDPARRFATMDELLAELQTATRRPAQAILALGGLAVAAIVIALLASQTARTEPCTMSPELLAGAWDTDREQAVAAAFAATGRSHATDSARRVAVILDDYSHQWLAARTDACMATRVRGDQSDAVLDARVRCLDRRRTELGELTRLYAEHPDGTLVDRAVQTALQLYPVESCSASGIATELPLPARPDRAVRIAALDQTLAALRANLLAKNATATRPVEDALAMARALEYPPLVARAAQLAAKLGVYATDLDAAERMLYDALAAAAAAHDDRAAADIWIDLIGFIAGQRGNPTLATTLMQPAEAAVVRAGAPRDLRNELEYARGVVQAARGEFVAARTSFMHAREVADRPFDVANCETALGNVELALGHLDAAETHDRAAIALLERQLGPRHPTVGLSLISLGNVAMQRRDDATAREVFERALAILGESLGTSHKAYLLTINNLGMIEARAGHFERARADYETALAAVEPLHVDAYGPELNLGNLDRTLGHVADARRHFERALAVAEAM